VLGKYWIRNTISKYRET